MFVKYIYIYSYIYIQLYIYMIIPNVRLICLENPQLIILQQEFRSHCSTAQQSAAPPVLWEDGNGSKNQNTVGLFNIAMENGP